MSLVALAIPSFPVSFPAPSPIRRPIGEKYSPANSEASFAIVEPTDFLMAFNGVSAFFTPLYCTYPFSSVVGCTSPVILSVALAAVFMKSVVPAIAAPAARSPATLGSAFVRSFFPKLLATSTPNFLETADTAASPSPLAGLSMNSGMYAMDSAVVCPIL